MTQVRFEVESLESFYEAINYKRINLKEHLVHRKNEHDYTD